MDKIQKLKKTPIGDGLIFKNAIIATRLKVADIRGAMVMPDGKIISNGKFFDLYYKENFTEEEKSAAIKALNAHDQDIFRKVTGNDSIKVEDLAAPSPTLIPLGGMNTPSPGNNTHVPIPKTSDGTQIALEGVNTNDMVTRLLAMVEKQMATIEESNKEKSKMCEKLLETHSLLISKLPDHNAPETPGMNRTKKPHINS